ncbi:ATPase [Chitinispirillum alkaliphilum]|nr:ATPase [Chitinispirillum alkaliphilum]
MEHITIDNVKLLLSHPVASTVEWIGQSEPLRQLLACWLVIDQNDLPLTPRIIGHPGIGKTTLAMAAAQQLQKPVYIMQCTSDTRPEDLLVSPVLSDQGHISYHASPLLSAALTGGVAILDEGNRMSEKSWASLAGLFDHRRTAESLVAGITISAHRDFRAAITMNEDSSTFEIPDYIMSRLQPGIQIPFPNRQDELRILSYNIPFSSEEVLEMCVEYLQSAHKLDLPYSIRDGINTMRYTLKLRQSDQTADTESLFRSALAQILGEEALDLEKLAERRKNDHLPAMNLGDLFFPDEDDLNPDSQEDF